jgi:hypothetical protein
VARLLTKIRQNACQKIIYYVMSEVKKDLEDVSAGEGIILYLALYN